MTKFIRRALCAALAAGLVPMAPAVAADSAAYPNLDSVTQLIPQTAGRSVLIDTNSATLYMIDDGRIVDSMKVIVGKPGEPTPEITTSLTAAIVNPYWHVPPDLVRTLTAPNVLKLGDGYLTSHGYEVVTSYDSDAQVIDPDTVDWQAVADGTDTVLVRQRPGPANSMGHIKFSLAAGDGIYLHDTPKKELFNEDDRDLSSGCVRLEDAPRLARWLLGDSVSLAASVPEEEIPMRSYVPVKITSLGPAAQSEIASLR
ncbi:MAG: L,D-transpeptidase family protein [Sphingomicrobium sp.]